MRGAVLAAAAAVVLVAAGLAWGAAQRTGPAWDDAGDRGHSELASHLSTQAHVAVLESSLALLPPGSGPGEALFLFATPRAPTPGEALAVKAFAERGGQVVVAADGGHANAWLAPLGGVLNGLPPVLPPNATAGPCLRVTFTLEGRAQPACLPSPTILADQEQQTVDGHTVVGRLDKDQEVGLDLDGDGNLGPGDEPPAQYPVAYQWSLGSGRVTLVADAEAWSNGALRDAPDNLALAGALAGTAATIYLDSTGHAVGPLAATASGVGAAAADPTSLAGGALLLALAALAGAFALQRRHKPWHPHAQDLASTPPHILEQATAHLRAALHGPAPPYGGPAASTPGNPSGGPGTPTSGGAQPPRAATGSQSPRSLESKP